MTDPSYQDFRELVRSHTDLAGLIGEAIALQPRSGGRESVGLCCFHDDRNPSLRVYPDRQTFRCWSCQTGGDCFTFVMKREGVSFPEALEILARRANLTIPKRLSGSTPEQQNSRAKLFEVLQWAENEFHRTLLESAAAAPARDYLQERGFTSEIIRRYKLGFHPNDWQWIKNRAGQRYSGELLREARLIGEKEGRTFDYFVNRVLFPIHNERGQAVSFGGRILPGDPSDAKYFNGLESSVFHKSRLLYAIDSARDAIRKSGTVIVVEGYTDCLSCHQHGVENVVGTLGTALTEEHVTALKRHARQVVLLFDGDDAGRRAAVKAVEKFLAQEVDLRILTLPEKLDPAEFLAKYDATALSARVAEAPEAWDYKFQSARTEHDMTSVDGRERIVNEMLELLASVPNMAGSLRESMLIANLAQRMQTPESSLRDRLKKIRGEQSRRFRVDKPSDSQPEFSAEAQRILNQRLTRDDKLECDLLEVFFAAPQFARLISDVVLDVPFRNSVFSHIIDESLHLCEETGTWSLGTLLDRIDDAAIKAIVVAIDEQVMGKNLQTKLSEGGLDDEGIPVLLTQSLENLLSRKAQQQNATIAVQLSQPAGPEDGEGVTEEELLRKAAEFHQRRATKKTTV